MSKTEELKKSTDELSLEDLAEKSAGEGGPSYDFLQLPLNNMTMSKRTTIVRSEILLCFSSNFHLLNVPLS